MRPRFFCQKPIQLDAIVELEGPEQHHLANVLRMPIGARVTLFDGRGSEYAAEVTELGRNVVRLKALSRSDVDRELPFTLTLGVALPKGDRQHWLVEKSVELGVSKFVPLITDRGVAQPHVRSLPKLERWVVAAAKQCGRNRLMQIEAPATLHDYFEQAGNHTVLLAHPGPHAQPIRETLQQLGRDHRPIFLAIGPEGGFTAEELAANKAADTRLVHLGSRILRIETAAILLAASVVYAKQ